MNDNKLELKDVCGYLPYDLCVECNDTHAKIIGFDEYSLLIEGGYIYMGDAKPILLHMSDLTKEITHKGKKFVPIVELAKTIYPDLEWTVNFINSCCSDNHDELTVFDRSFTLYTREGYHLDSIDTVSLYDKLSEWMFDYRGLIEKSLAINVNDLEVNPYE